MFEVLINGVVGTVGFLGGCWFYRWMLKRNPERLQKLVDLTNATGDRAKELATKVGDQLKSNNKE